MRATSHTLARAALPALATGLALAASIGPGIQGQSSLRDVLLGRWQAPLGIPRRIGVMRFAMRFQQYTGPVTARMIEQAGADAITTTAYHDPRVATMHSGSHTPQVPALNADKAAAIRAAVASTLIFSSIFQCLPPP